MLMTRKFLSPIQKYLRYLQFNESSLVDAHVPNSVLSAEEGVVMSKTHITPFSQSFPVAMRIRGVRIE